MRSRREHTPSSGPAGGPPDTHSEPDPLFADESSRGDAPRLIFTEASDKDAAALFADEDYLTHPQGETPQQTAPQQASPASTSPSAPLSLYDLPLYVEPEFSDELTVDFSEQRINPPPAPGYPGPERQLRRSPGPFASRDLLLRVFQGTAIVVVSIVGLILLLPDGSRRFSPIAQSEQGSAAGQPPKVQIPPAEPTNGAGPAPGVVEETSLVADARSAPGTSPAPGATAAPPSKSDSPAPPDVPAPASRGAKANESGRLAGRDRTPSARPEVTREHRPRSRETAAPAVPPRATRTAAAAEPKNPVPAPARYPVTTAAPAPAVVTTPPPAPPPSVAMAPSAADLGTAPEARPAAAAPEEPRAAPPRPTATTGTAVRSTASIERDRVRALLARYEAAYSDLDAAAAARLYPALDRKALARAFSALDSQQILLQDCRIQVAETTARATCAGTASWRPKVGGGGREQAREWSFDLKQVQGNWQIGSVRVR